MPRTRGENGITDLARRQLAERLKIPFPYFERMRAEQPDLLDRNVNTWLRTDPERRMLRTLDGQVRAVLSDRYRRLDHYDLAEHILPLLQRLPEARFESVELTAIRLYLKVVTPRVEVEIAPGNVVQAGIVISNSEVGQGTLSVQPLVYRLICRNGLIASDRALRKTHVGRTLDAGEGAITVFRDDTLAADDRAFFLKVRDVVEAAVSAVPFGRWCKRCGKRSPSRSPAIRSRPSRCSPIATPSTRVNVLEYCATLLPLVICRPTAWSTPSRTTRRTSRITTGQRSSKR